MVPSHHALSLSASSFTPLAPRAPAIKDRLRAEERPTIKHRAHLLGVGKVSMSRKSQVKLQVRRRTSEISRDISREQLISQSPRWEGSRSQDSLSPSAGVLNTVMCAPRPRPRSEENANSGRYRKDEQTQQGKPIPKSRLVVTAGRDPGHRSDPSKWAVAAGLA